MRLTGCACGWCSIVPPYVLDAMENSADAQVRRSAGETRTADAIFRTARANFAATVPMSKLALAPEDHPLKRVVYDCESSNDLARKRVLEEGGSVPADDCVREAYTGAEATWKFYNQIFQRSSVDNDGVTLVSSVHYRRKYNNAVWNGQQMAYGDGDGVIFERFTKSLDVIGHELTHGVTQYTAGLQYEGQSGALNEHFSDVFGVLVKQWSLKQNNPQTAGWLVGEGLLKPSINGKALRSMSDPGTAYDDEESGLGKDPQPAHMRNYRELPNTEQGDHGGVHINSGIPNRAFYLAATAIGKPAWQTAGKIWYVTLTERLRPDSDFEKCAKETISVARDFFDNDVAEKVASAWVAVGVTKAGAGPMASFPAAAIRRIRAAKTAKKAGAKRAVAKTRVATKTRKRKRAR
jgi:Zn-dependent metalloprotease